MTVWYLWVFFTFVTQVNQEGFREHFIRRTSTGVGDQIILLSSASTILARWVIYCSRLQLRRSLWVILKGVNRTPVGRSIISQMNPSAGLCHPQTATLLSHCSYMIYYSTAAHSHMLAPNRTQAGEREGERKSWTNLKNPLSEFSIIHRAIQPRLSRLKGVINTAHMSSLHSVYHMWAADSSLGSVDSVTTHTYGTLFVFAVSSHPVHFASHLSL